MKTTTAYKIARAAIEKEIRLFAFDANLFERRIVRSIATERSAKKVERLREAIRILLVEGDLMSINDPVLIRFQFKKRNFILTRGRETFYDPDTRELLEFNTVGEARSWSVAKLGVDPTYEGKAEPKLDFPQEELPLFAKKEEE